MVQQLLAREVDLIETQANRPAVSPLDFGFIPTKQLQEAYVVKDYVMHRVEPPRMSPLGDHHHGVSSGKTETERNIGTFKYTYTIGKVDLRIAQRNGYDIIGQNTAMMRSAMEHSIMALILQGSGAITSTDLPDIPGMLDVGEDVDAALTAGAKWDTATKPIVHAAAGFSDLVQNNYFGDFWWILSRNLEAGAIALNNAANPRTHEEIIKASYARGNWYYMANGASAYATGGYTINPLPAASTTDGVWIMGTNSNGAGDLNYYLGQVSNGIVTTVPDTMDDNDNLTISMEWRGTPVFRGATLASAGSAPYIVFEPDVDLAA